MRIPSLLFAISLMAAAVVAQNADVLRHFDYDRKVPLGIKEAGVELLDYRQKIGAEKFDAFIARNAWFDPGKFVSHATPATVFLQFGSQEKFLTPERARGYASIVSEPKQFKEYDAPHALNAEARRDRIAFLTEQLHLKPLDPALVAGVPDLLQPPEPPSQ